MKRLQCHPDLMGHVTEYASNDETQGRGTLHTHALIWITRKGTDITKPDVAEEIRALHKEYVSCDPIKMPSEVQHVQNHKCSAKKCLRRCVGRPARCRYGFPIPPREPLRPYSEEEQEEHNLHLQNWDHIKEKLGKAACRHQS